MWALFLSAFTTLFVVIDPPGCAPIYAGLVKGATTRQASAMAVRATFIATLILLVFALFGEDLLGGMLEDNVHEFINLMDERGELYFTDRQARRIDLQLPEGLLATCAYRS
mgnify:CR=1 FL=1